MGWIDVFNGDADGICALVQLRNAQAGESTLVTGVKRDLELLDRVEAQPGDRVTVLDISLDKNRRGLERLLAHDVTVFYADHHFAGEIPASENLEALIDPSPEVCTSILVNRYLGGRFREWAVTAAFGDNLKQIARALAAPLGLAEAQLEQLERLGTCMNYNAYGASVADLHFPPEVLFRAVQPFPSPFVFLEEARETFEQLEAGYRDDMARVQAVAATHQEPHAAVFILPDERWARRVSGVYSNDLANRVPGRAHAVLTERPDGTYLVSVRAPLENRSGADDLCRCFPTGGGRKAAAGINRLPADRLQEFIDQLCAMYR